MESFYIGFEKRAYDYGQEVDDLNNYAKARHKDNPMPWAPAMGVGGLTGAGAGAILGPGGGSAKGLLAGALLGAGFGALVAKIDRDDIKEQKKIMAMSPEIREKYLRSAAHRENEDKRTREITRAMKKIEYALENQNKQRAEDL